MKWRIMITALFLGSCSVGPDYEPPSLSIADTWASDPLLNPAVQDEVALDWWTLFEDPLLERYIDMAQAANKDVAIARANVRQARALRRQAAAPFFPFLDFSNSGQRTRSSDAVSGFNAGEERTLYDAGFDASWEIDIFGGTRRAVEAADARLESAEDNRRDVLLTTLSEVARNYYEARGLQKRIAITEKNINLQQRTYNLVRRRQEVGESSAFDTVRALGQFQLTESRLPNLNADLKTTIYRLSVLTGQPPEALMGEMTAVKPLPALPDIVPVGLRSELLRRRPDVRQAERALAAEVADIGVATADLFPRFFLTGNLASQSRRFGDLFSSASEAWGFAGLVQWPLFRGGAIRAQIEAQEAGAEAALAQYEKNVLEALQDTETALTRYGQELLTRIRLQEAVVSRRQSVEFAQALFNAGEQDFLPVLDAEREYTAAEDELVVSETRSILNLVSLYTALGGGWQMFEENANTRAGGPQR